MAPEAAAEVVVVAETVVGEASEVVVVETVVGETSEVEEVAVVVAVVGGKLRVSISSRFPVFKATFRRLTRS